ncbi:AAA family ATPase [Haladaptatus sp. F3-133]|jgi:replication factor C small subunit|uniref:Replication factor C small subunit n=1 Tax=Halorutilus salinus TaxID=2487751 RepID=A0A9Q4C5H6_9EURY|nr:AAA family ATPase [Halorutilus salinus]MCX2819437.1 AAA family ATPase [Halorutilus salinus]
MLWTAKHAPESFDDLPQDEVARLLPRAAGSGLNVVLHGPKGAGKTAAARLLGDDPYVLNASDFFGMTKDEIADDPRFRGFITAKRKRETSKADLINHVLKQVASHSSVGEGRRTIVIDNAEDTRRDFQQALRRVVERFSEQCRFVLTTRSLSALIPAIRSRALPVAVRQATKEERVEALERIVDREGVETKEAGVEFVAEEAQTLRESVLLLQTVATRGKVTMGSVLEAADDVEGDRVPDMLEDARAGGFDEAVETLDDMMIEGGWSGDDLLRRFLHETDKPGEVVAIGDVEHALKEGANDRIHLEKLIAEIAAV